MFEASFESFDARQKKERVFITEMFLNDCEEDQALLGRMITRDEPWVFEYDPSTKSLSMQWKRSDEPRHKKARMTLPQQILMLILFFDAQGVVLVEWVPYRKNVDAYRNVLDIENL